MLRRELQQILHDVLSERIGLEDAGEELFGPLDRAGRRQILCMSACASDPARQELAPLDVGPLLEKVESAHPPSGEQRPPVQRNRGRPITPPHRVPETRDVAVDGDRDPLSLGHQAFAQSQFAELITQPMEVHAQAMLSLVLARVRPEENSQFFP